ncbi:hypothetical protein C8J56DRAFT_1032727 [Mycena floridula]|nr:hypothetical protein C8J56DRAFT_1032727 [Mycena floridula]
MTKNLPENDLDDQIYKSLEKLEDDLFQPNLILLGIRQFDQALWHFVQRGLKEGKARQANQKTVIGPREGRNTSSFFYQGRLTTRTCHSDGSDATAVDALFDTDNQDPRPYHPERRRGYNSEAGDKGELLEQRKAQRASMRERRRKQTKRRRSEGISPGRHYKVVPDDSTNTMPLILNITSSALTGFSSTKAQHPKPSLFSLSNMLLYEMKRPQRSQKLKKAVKRKDPKKTRANTWEKKPTQISPRSRASGYRNAFPQKLSSKQLAIWLGESGLLDPYNAENRLAYNAENRTSVNRLLSSDLASHRQLRLKDLRTSRRSFVNSKSWTTEGSIDH